MLIRSVPLYGGAPTDGRNGGDPAVRPSRGFSGLPDSALPEAALPEAALPEVELPCRTTEADLWFAEAPDDLERAKAACADCPVRAECLAGALRRREPWGVWGGEIFERGRVIARKRPRGRPSKADLARDEQLAAAS